MPRIYRCLYVLAMLAGAPLIHAQAPQLEIHGAGTRLEENIRAYLDLSSEACDAAEWRLRAIARNLDERITNAGRALGHYQMTVEKTFSRTSDCWRLRLDIDAGLPVRLSVVNIVLEGEGEDNGLLRSLVANSGLRVGSQLNHGRFDSFKSQLLQGATTQGFFDANYLASEVLVSVRDNTARINMLLDTGARYQVGDINIRHDILGEPLIDRYVTLQRGQPYLAQDLEQLRSELRSGGYFAGVSVVPDIEHLSDGEVPIEIDLTGGPRHSYSAGLGFATDTGPRVRLGYENRYLNNRGHTFDADVNASESITTYQVSYGIPMRRPAYDKLQLYTGFGEEKLNRAQSQRLATGLNYSTWQGGQWINSYGLSVEREDYRFGDDPSQRAELIIPAFTTSITRGPQTAYPLHGWSVMARVKGGSEDLGSSTNFLQGYGRIKFIQKFGPGRFLLRVEGGITEVRDFNALPISQRFFAGGDASVRGYDYKTLGPMNDDEIVVGGSRLLTTSIEYDYRVYGDWALAVFMDEGNAFHREDYTRYRGVGTGVRWISPVGPVRLDIAKALDGNKGWRLHLSVGPDL